MTLVTVDAAYHDLTAKALRTCLKHAEFGDVITFSDRSIIPEAANFYVRPKSVNEAMAVLWYKVPSIVQTKFFLVIQWDSWIVNPACWTDEFLQYDYIGAPWCFPTANVGNGGFSLRSTALARHVAARQHEYPLIHPEDDTLCRVYRHRLEADGFKWAQEQLALRFSFECTGPVRAGQHFGFHCLRYFPFVLPEAEVQERFAMLPPNLKQGGDFELAAKLAGSLGARCGEICVS